MRVCSWATDLSHRLCVRRGREQAGRRLCVPLRTPVELPGGDGRACPHRAPHQSSGSPRVAARRWRLEPVSGAACTSPPRADAGHVRACRRHMAGRGSGQRRHPVIALPAKARTLALDAAWVAGEVPAAGWAERGPRTAVCLGLSNSCQSPLRAYNRSSRAAVIAAAMLPVQARPWPGSMVTSPSSRMRSSDR